MRPGSKEEFLCLKKTLPTRTINDRRKKNIKVTHEKRNFTERRNFWSMDKQTGISNFTG